LATTHLDSKSGFEKLLLDESPDALIATTTHGKVLYWSRGAESIFGYSSAEALGRSVEEIIVPADRVEEERAILNEAIQTGFSSTYESIRRRKDGSRVYVDISYRIVRDAHGDIEYVLSSKKDVTQLKVMRDGNLVETRFRDLLESTEQRVAERTAELQQSQEQLRAATETANDAIVSADGNGNIINFNQVATRVFGYSVDETIGRPLTLLMPERLRDGHRAGMARYLATGEARLIGRTTTLTGRRKDGSEFPMELSLASWKSRGRAFFTGIIRDITDRNRFDETLRLKNVELENANFAKDRFLASMSHELRTPLNAIIGFTGTLLMKLPGPLNVDQERQLKTVQGSGRHLLSLINELLDLAKIEAGKVDLHLETTACRAVVEEVIASLRPQAEAKGLQFGLTACPDDTTVRTDRRVLSQIILNLANNAIKFTEAGSVLIHLRNGAGPVEIAVTDTGVGILPEDQEKLFGAFSQLNASPGPRREGAGLGLHLSRKLAELLGGKITFRSEHGKGSTFTLTLAGP
jgi:PAS domain S-box-containing protein